MKGLKLARGGEVLLAGLLALPATAALASRTGSPVPGTLNYIEGQASIGSESLSSRSVGSVELQPGQTLTSREGKAEILLTPGVLLRVGSNSAVRMISPGLTNTEVEVRRGEAQVEVDQIFKQNNLLVLEDGATTQLQKRGVYDFNADLRTVRVLDGQALLRDGDTTIKIKGGREVALDTPELKTKKFDKDSFKADNGLYRWSSLRSAYLAEANADQAPVYLVNGWYGPGWLGAGWYWNPWFSCYTFVPADGVFYSPFGWGFYSPLWAYRAPVYGHVYHRFGPDYHPWGHGFSYDPAFHGGTEHPELRGGSNPGFRRGFGGGELHAGGFGGWHGGFGHPGR
jgi:hypothetical protein